MDGRMDGKSLHSTGLCPLSGLLPCFPWLAGCLGLRPGCLGLRPGWMAQRGGRTYGPCFPWLAGCLGLRPCWMAQGSGRTDGLMNRWKISPFYRTSSPIGAAVLPSLIKTKEKVEQGKGTADYLMPFSYLSSLNPPHPWQGALYWQSGTPIAPFQRKVLRTIRPTPKRPCSKHFQILLCFSIDYLIILEVFVVLFARWRGLYPDPN